MTNKAKFVKLWILDSRYIASSVLHSLIFRKPHHSFTAKHLSKDPVVLIPGITQKWNAFRKLIPALVKDGHPVYTVPALRRNHMPVKDGAAQVRQVIEKHNLQNVVLIGLSKGGIVGRYTLSFLNPDDRIKKFIALSAPFAGTHVARLMPFRSYREMIPSSKTITLLNNQNHHNHKITSVFGTYDNAVIPLESSRLEGAKNIQVNIEGHARIVFDDNSIKTILAEVNN